MVLDHGTGPLDGGPAIETPKSIMIDFESYQEDSSDIVHAEEVNFDQLMNYDDST